MLNTGKPPAIVQSDHLKSPISEEMPPMKMNMIGLRLFHNSWPFFIDRGITK